MLHSWITRMVTGISVAVLLVTNAAIGFAEAVADDRSTGKTEADCTFTFYLDIVPGLSDTPRDNSATVSKDKQQTVTCGGIIQGKALNFTGGATGKRYYDESPSAKSATCTRAVGSSPFTISIFDPNGSPVTFSGDFDFDFNGTFAAIKGPNQTGSAQVTPTRGDCRTAAVTEVSVVQVVKVTG